MPSTHRVAQCIRHPNGTHDDPFIVSVPRQTMIDFAVRALVETRPDIPRDWNNRIDCVMDCGFWNTLEVWARRAPLGDAGMVGERPRPDGLLSAAEMLPMFRAARGAGPYAHYAVGVAHADFFPMMGRTIVAWAQVIEEWAIPNVIEPRTKR